MHSNGWFLRAALAAALCLHADAAWAQLQVTPATVKIDNPEATQQVLVKLANSPRDLTHDVAYEIADPKIATVDAGLIRPRGEGKTTLTVKSKEGEAKIPVEVTGLKAPTPVDFKTQIIPLFSKSGCNTGGCHGKSEGKNGFKLSIFGFDVAGDYNGLVKESRGRRVFAASPEASLVLRKASGQIPHAGGRRLPTDGLRYQRLLRWITEGAVFETGAPAITGIEIEPTTLSMKAGESQQLRVTAVAADGKKFCVTADAEYESNASSIAGVDGRGRILATGLTGQASVLVRYLGHVAVCRIAAPKTDVAFVRPPEANFIDKHAWDHLQRLGIPAADLSSDAVFLRRVYLDTIGTLPTAAEARAFHEDKAPDKRAKLIDRLLERPEYADYWAMLWSDLLRVDRDAITPAGAMSITRWLRKELAQNRPYDEFARAIMTARGSISEEGPAPFFKAVAEPEDMSRSFSQLFLGVRINCAQCHHHPADKWDQEDYFALAGFFTGVTRKPLQGGGEAVVLKKPNDMKHPRTGLLVPVRALGAEKFDADAGPDRRIPLAKWLTAPENPFFARAFVNRLWQHYYSRGLVEPVDDMRATNPAAIEPLLDELAKFFQKNKYDVKAVTRLMLNSRLYQLAGKPGVDGVPADDRNFSQVPPKAIPAEVLLDAISQATGVPEKFNGWPEGYRAIQLWDNRMPSYFFRIFGRPVRATVCECERSSEPSIAQALHLMNSEEIGRKIRHKDGFARKLARSKMSPTEIVDELYLATLSRFPDDRERAVMLKLFEEAADDRIGAVEDALWVLLNSRGFVYNH